MKKIFSTVANAAKWLVMSKDENGEYKFSGKKTAITVVSGAAVAAAIVGAKKYFGKNAEDAQPEVELEEVDTKEQAK